MINSDFTIQWASRIGHISVSSRSRCRQKYLAARQAAMDARYSWFNPTRSRFDVRSSISFGCTGVVLHRRLQLADHRFTAAQFARELGCVHRHVDLILSISEFGSMSAYVNRNASIRLMKF